MERLLGLRDFLAYAGDAIFSSRPFHLHGANAVIRTVNGAYDARVAVRYTVSDGGQCCAPSTFSAKKRLLAEHLNVFVGCDVDFNERHRLRAQAVVIELRRVVSPRLSSAMEHLRSGRRGPAHVYYPNSAAQEQPRWWVDENSSASLLVQVPAAVWQDAVAHGAEIIKKRGGEAPHDGNAAECLPLVVRLVGALRDTR